MDYYLKFFEKKKLQKVVKEKVYMFGEGNKYISCYVPASYDTVMLFDKDVRFIITYYFVSRNKGKSVFKRDLGVKKQ